MIAVADKAKLKAYSPYSNFRVGAALLSRDGVVYAGTNVENSSYGLTVCAERTAVFRAVSEGATSFRAIVVTTDVTEGPVYPCGKSFLVFVLFAWPSRPIIRPLIHLRFFLSFFFFFFVLGRRLSTGHVGIWKYGCVLCTTGWQTHSHYFNRFIASRLFFSGRCQRSTITSLCKTL